MTTTLRSERLPPITEHLNERCRRCKLANGGRTMKTTSRMTTAATQALPRVLRRDKAPRRRKTSIPRCWLWYVLSMQRTKARSKLLRYPPRARARTPTIATSSTQSENQCLFWTQSASTTPRAPVAKLAESLPFPEGTCTGQNPLQYGASQLAALCMQSIPTSYSNHGCRHRSLVAIGLRDWVTRWGITAL